MSAERERLSYPGRRSEKKDFLFAIRSGEKVGIDKKEGEGGKTRAIARGKEKKKRRARQGGVRRKIRPIHGKRIPQLFLSEY